MNLIDLTVVKVIDKPYFYHKHWFVKVLVEAYGVESQSTVMVSTEDEANAVNVGYVFLG